MGNITDINSRCGMQRISAPAPIQASHDASTFDCGKPPLNDWLRAKALKSEGRSARTYVITVGDKIVAYYCLAAGGVNHSEVPPEIRRNMPNPVPIMLLGRLAVDKEHQGTGLGSALFRETMLRVASVHQQVGIAALMVHAIDDEAKAFYVKYGMQAFPYGTKTLFLPMRTLIRSIS